MIILVWSSQVAFRPDLYIACDRADHTSIGIEGDKHCHLIESMEERFWRENRVFVRGRGVVVLVGREGRSKAIQNAVRMVDSRALDRDCVK